MTTLVGECRLRFLSLASHTNLHFLNVYHEVGFYGFLVFPIPSDFSATGR